ncbi:unnamed protein product [Pleuronectes platessa]|uniref:Uncharacterized protein n=1 Tax=Pleuronectes platessa TaxID=8262 RepID=A0A9N7ULZ0_PLEPL|nr:unnamed protein product [Pleuronectes platessa]
MNSPLPPAEHQSFMGRSDEEGNMGGKDEVEGLRPQNPEAAQRAAHPFVQSSVKLDSIKLKPKLKNE